MYMVDKPLDNVDTLVIYCPTWVGDIVMATPVFDCFRDSFPDAKIVAVMKKSARGIVTDGPWFDGFIDSQDKSLGGFLSTVGQMRRYRPDVAVLLPNSSRSVLTALFGGAKKIYGYRRNLRGALLTGGPEPLRSNGKIVPVPMVEYYLEICRWLGLKVPDKVRPTLFIGEKLRRRGEALLDKYGITAADTVIALNPGASFGSSKCWLPERFAKVAELCQAEFNARVLLLSGPNEETIAQAVKDNCRADLIDTAADKVDLELLKPLMQRCNLLITNDTGPRHYAVAFDVPAVVIMGSTDPRFTASNLDRTVVIRKELDCSPCHEKICPREHQCMTEITAEEVFAAAKEMLKEGV